MLPSLPYLLWEQAQHTASLRLPIFCTASAEEHRDYSQPPLPSAFVCIALKSKFWKVWKFHMPCLMRVWRMIPYFAPVHTQHLWVPLFKSCLQHCCDTLSAALPSARVTASPASHAQHINPWEAAALVSPPGALICQELSQAAEGRCLFPSTLGSLFSHTLSPGQGRTEQNIVLGKEVSICRPGGARANFLPCASSREKTSFMLLCLTKGSTTSELFCF